MVLFSLSTSASRGVSCWRILTMNRPVQFLIELFVHKRVQALTQVLHFLIKFTFGASPACRNNKETKNKRYCSGCNAGHVEKCETNGCCRYGSDCAQG